MTVYVFVKNKCFIEPAMITIGGKSCDLFWFRTNLSMLATCNDGVTIKAPSQKFYQPNNAFRWRGLRTAFVSSSIQNKVVINIRTNPPSVCAVQLIVQNKMSIVPKSASIMM